MHCPELLPSFHTLVAVCGKGRGGGGGVGGGGVGGGGFASSVTAVDGQYGVRASNMDWVI